MNDPITQAREEMRTLLSETESKRLLQEAGISVEMTHVAVTADDAAQYAEEAGYPVVLKIASPDIAHKSDVGGVAVGLEDAESVRAEFRAMLERVRAAAPGARIEGVAVQHMADAGTEVIIGATLDPQFGPTIMFGLGGVFVEVLKDVSFRVVPLTAEDAASMVREIRGLPILQGVRGQAGVDLEAIERMILQVSEFVAAHEEIAELDLNPVIAYPDGAIAVDARIVLTSPQEAGAEAPVVPAIDRARLHRALNPSTVVVVGDKGPNYQWLNNLSEFTGTRYSVQLDERQIPGIEEMGVPNFSSLLEVPGDVDLVICSVPRHVTPALLRDAAEKGVGGVAMFTSGFAETGEPEAIELQRQVVEIARNASMPVVGPNCMGVYNRRLGVKFTPLQEQGEGGDLSVISQSGTHGSAMTAAAQRQGVKVARTISIGNAAVLNESDYLEYLMEDPETPVIAMYLEGVRDGRRFARLLREVTKRKPVIIWRGGRSRAGARAVQSHTGSLASDAAIWEALLRQAGAISVDSLEEMADVAAALVHAPASTKRGLALVAQTGGQSVAITDQFERHGFEVPELSADSYAQLAEFFITVGGSYRNPFDASSTIGREEGNMEKILDILAADPAIDGGVAIELRVRTRKEGVESLNPVLEALDAYRTRTGQPVIGLLPAAGAMQVDETTVVEARLHVAQAGFPVFASFERGAKAFGRAVAYHTWRERQ